MANIFQRIFGRKETETNVVQEERSSIFGGIGLGYNTASSYSNSQAMRLSTAYACTNLLSNSVALLPIKIVKYVDGRKVEVNDHPLQKVLNLAPNKKYNKFNFFKLLIESVILNGNGYIYIKRDDKLNVVGLELIDPSYVTPLPQEDGSVKYLVSGMKAAVDSVNMIHIFQHCDEMMNGISVIKYADMALAGAYAKERHSDNFFKGGAGLMGVLKASSPLTDAQKTQIAQSWERSISKTASGGVAILPQGLDFQSISVSPEDSQLLEARAYDVVQICRFFNVSPLKVFDYSHMSYSSLEQVSLSYLQDSVLPYTQLLEDELNRKLFKPSEVGEYGVDFDYTEIIQADKKAEADYYRQLLVNGILSINEVRNKLGYSPVDGDYADQHWIQISYATADAIASGAYIKGQDQAQGQKVDNKVKQEGEE
jgi:HK97 family phage portal protein